MPTNYDGGGSTEGGYSVPQFLSSSAADKLAVMLTMDHLRREATAARREDFERYLPAIPHVAPFCSRRLGCSLR